MKIIVICGPTGVGKTKMSISLAKYYNAEIINADSMQIYKELDIGTAKIREEEKDSIPHHLLNIKDVSEDYSVYDYQIDARGILNKLISENKNVVIVGGTGLYIKALLYDYVFEKENNKLEYSNLSNQEIYNKIISIDPNIDVHINNRKRLERCLNKLNNDKPINDNGDTLLYENVYFIGLTTERKELYEKINNRVDLMFEEGLVLEVQKLYDKGIQSKAIKTGIGYKELYLYFDGKLSLDEIMELIKKNSRHYAKRQYTWFNNKMNVKWFDVNFNDFNLTIENVKKYVNSN